MGDVYESTPVGWSAVLPSETGVDAGTAYPAVMGDIVRVREAAVSNRNCTVLVEADLTVTLCTGVALP